MKDLINIVESSIVQSVEVKKNLLSNCTENIYNTAILLANQIQKGGKIMFCGNGGSAADSQHIAAELVVRLRSSVQRPAISAMALTVDPSIMTAGANDLGFDNVFARYVESIGKPNDVLVGISTSGNSQNIIRAFEQAKKQNIITIGLLGAGGGKILEHSEMAVVVPSKITARIQESHILVGHIWCEIIEEVLFPEYFKQ